MSETRQAEGEEARELRWIDNILDLEHVPREEYSAQGGGMCELTRAGRVHWLAERRREAERLLDQDQAACLAERDRWQFAQKALPEPVE